MFTVAFWKATAERTVRGAGEGVAAALGIGGIVDDVPVTAATIAVGALLGALTGLALSLVAIPVGGAPSPSFVPRQEVDAALEPVRELVEREGIVVAHERLQRLDQEKN